VVSKTFLFFTCFFVFVSSVWGQDCVPFRENETSREGFSATIVYNEKKSRRHLKGRVVLQDGDKPQRDVFVEIFPIGERSKEKPRAAGCRTGETGEFEFTDLPKGKYKIRLSKDGGYRITEIGVKVDPASKSSKPIYASIEPGY